MNALRVLRIVAVAIALPFLFALSQAVTTARGQAPIEGLEWALGALAVLFLLRALATEYSRGPEANGMKDLQWGLLGGLVLTIASRLWG